MDIINNTLIALSRGVPGLFVAGLTLVLIFLALIRKESSLMIFAAVLTIPFAYAGAWWGFGLFVRLLPLFSLGSAYAIGKDDAIFSWALAAPTFGYLIYILFNILVTGF
jgi:hypothetical protein